MDSDDLRFGGIRRLFGTRGYNHLQTSTVMVVGVGGVGSWTVEALARSGVGHLILVDLDDVCVSNTNRQLHALGSTVGKQKVDVLKARCLDISPTIKVTLEHTFATSNTIETLLKHRPDVVIDAIDQPKNKCLLIQESRRAELDIVTVGGAGGLLDPTKVQVDDLSRAFNDKLLKRVRKSLRQDFGWPRGDKRWKVPAVFSSELPVYPSEDGETCHASAQAGPVKLDCASGFGAATYLTGTFGFFAAHLAIAQIMHRNKDRQGS